MTTGFLRDIQGIFYRAVDAAHADAALAGSRRAGRYSAPDQPTLYLSASPEGVAAAMIAHRSGKVTRTVLGFHVTAPDIFDLRDRAALARVRAAVGEPFGAWQQQSVDCGAEPASWRVRRWIEAQGANGLIDPSRQAPGLWHLVLFRWNMPGAPTLLPVDG